jgi:hypothetical protein
MSARVDWCRQNEVTLTLLEPRSSMMAIALRELENVRELRVPIRAVPQEIDGEEIGAYIETLYIVTGVAVIEFRSTVANQWLHDTLTFSVGPVINRQEEWTGAVVTGSLVGFGKGQYSVPAPVTTVGPVSTAVVTSLAHQWVLKRIEANPGGDQHQTEISAELGVYGFSAIARLAFQANIYMDVGRVDW